MTDTIYTLENIVEIFGLGLVVGIFYVSIAFVLGYVINALMNFVGDKIK